MLGILALVSISFSSFAIMNGRDANLSQSASTVFIHIKNAERTCTAVIIHDHLLLTAAHCLDGDIRPKTTLYISNDANNDSTKTLFVLKFAQLPKYTSSETKDLKDIQYDFAFIVIKESLLETFKLDSHKLPLLTADENVLKKAILNSDHKTMAYGYGVFNKSSDEGQKKELQSKVIEVNTDINVIVTKSSEANVGICEGDSGGGLFVETENNEILLAGIVSGITAEKGCGTDSSRAWYSMVHKNICWVQKNSGIKINSINCPP